MPPPLPSTTTATVSGWVLRVHREDVGATSGVHPASRSFTAPPCDSVRPRTLPAWSSAFRGARRRRRVLRPAVVARRAPRDDRRSSRARGMNAYVYAPKDDAKHRAGVARAVRRRARCERFAELADACATDAGVRFGFAISPGPRHHLRVGRRPRDAARRSSRRCSTHGVALVPAAARRHPDATRARAAPGGRSRPRCSTRCAPAAPDATLTVCPTEYVGTRPSPYLADLGAGLPPRRRRDVDRPDGVLADDHAPTTRGPGPRRSAAARRSSGTTIR